MSAERRVRARAKRQGFALVKLRSEDGYRLIFADRPYEQELAVTWPVPLSKHEDWLAGRLPPRVDILEVDIGTELEELLK